MTVTSSWVVGSRWLVVIHLKDGQGGKMRSGQCIMIARVWSATHFNHIQWLHQSLILCIIIPALGFYNTSWHDCVSLYFLSGTETGALCLYTVVMLCNVTVICSKCHRNLFFIHTVIMCWVTVWVCEWICVVWKWDTMYYYPTSFFYSGACMDDDDDDDDDGWAHWASTNSQVKLVETKLVFQWE